MKTILFDLDGTLIDHFTAIHKSINFAQRSMGLEESEYNTVKSAVGGSARTTIKRLLGDDCDEEKAFNLFRQKFEETKFSDVEILPYVGPFLNALNREKYTLGVLTNKIHSDAVAILQHLKLSQYFDAILGVEDGPSESRKPDPQFTMHILEALDTTSEETLMIGDSPYDLQTAESGCLQCALVATGTHTQNQLVEYLDEARIFADMRALASDLFSINLPK